jgi:hypothetical protein
VRSFAIYNNILVSINSAIDLAGVTQIAYINNKLWNSTSGNSGYIVENNFTQIIGNTFSIHADPLFLDDIDYHLSAYSPAIDAGLEVLESDGFTFEILGKIYSCDPIIYIDNYVGNSPDIGAYEFEDQVN